MKRILILLSALLLSLLAAEGALRLAGPVQDRTAPLLSRFHPVLGWEPEPGRSASWTPPDGEPVLLEVNAQGLRGQEVLAPKGASERRLLALGDAGTLGRTVAAAEAFPEVLAGLLRGRGLDARALNAGVDRYSLDQQLLWLRRNGPGLQPDLILLAFGREGLHRLVRERYGKFPKPRLGLDANMRLIPPELPLPEPIEAPFTEFLEQILLRRIFTSPLRPMLESPALARPIPAEYAPYLVEVPAETRECWGLLAALLGELAAEAKGSGALLLAFALPDHAQVSGEETHRILEEFGLDIGQWNIDRPTAFFAAVAAEQGVAGLELLGYFRGAEKEGRRLFYPGDAGLRPAGHRLIAERLERRLQDLGWYGLK